MAKPKDDRYIKEIRERDARTAEVLIANDTGKIVATVIVSRFPTLHPKEQR